MRLLLVIGSPFLGKVAASRPAPRRVGTVVLDDRNNRPAVH